MPSQIALSINNLTVNVEGKPFIRDVTLSIPKGEIHGLLGPNGAGKTSLLRTVYRADEIVSGSIRALDRDIRNCSHSDWARLVGALVQSSGLLTGLTPLDIVEIGLKIYDLPPREQSRRRDEALTLVGLEDKREQPANRLSGGELQRCYFAQLLACDPEIYILDEPTNHLDLHYQLILLDEVKRRGKTVLMSLHDLNMTMRYCDQVYIMRNGQIRLQGTPQSALSRDNLIEYYKVDGSFNAGNLAVTGPVLCETQN